MIVVLLIILLITSGLVGGYSNMQKNRRLSNSAERVASTLHLARNLAISHNAIYHVRIHNWDEENGEISKDQHISIHCFPRMTDALTVTSESMATGGMTNEWSPHAQDSRKRIDELEQLRQAALVTGNTAAAQSYEDQKAMYRNSQGQPFNNYSVENIRLEQQTWLGVQEGSSFPINDNLVYFYPDGTASQLLTVFVTDSDRGDRDFRYKEGADPIALRRDQFNGGSNSGLRMIRVYQGGLIRNLNPIKPEEKVQ